LSGTLRLNLDVEGKYPDNELYDALHQVQLIKQPDITSHGDGSENSSATAVDGSQNNIFNDLESEIKSGGEK